MFGKCIPAVALWGKVEIAAVERNTARLGQCLRRLAFQALIAEGGRFGQKFVRWFAARLPFVIKRLIHPGGGRQAGLSVVTHNEVIAWMRNSAAFVIPQEGVIALDGIGDRCVTLLGWHQAVGELPDVIVIKRQRHVAGNPAIFDHRHGPANDAAETLAERVFRAGIG